jgi:hypothetical protein
LEGQTFDRLVNYLEGKETDEQDRNEAANMELQARKLIEELQRKA